MYRSIAFLGLVVLVVSTAAAEDAARASKSGKHLFILSGQSNMQGLKPAESFTPTVVEAFGKDKVIVVFDALGGQPIRRWYKEWKPAKSDSQATTTKTGDLYDRLMVKVNAAIDDQEIQSITFIWMQGERDANESYGEVYLASLKGLCNQLSRDFGRDDVNVVIGRLSDFDMQNARYKHWTMVREAQLEFVESHPRAAWVNTDDLNDGVNRKGKTIKDDLHYSAEGYKVLGKRFADEAIKLIRKT